ncbi:hypothetical protein BpHYR1_022613 [Brachionus plicatilis]|uniref:Uncharacterized protein n=1 Tax=Brachionus plicatilis TaxID=10195 RepID=A0A3M7RFR4_BRAPC|nr:hypothetical protein BpHYR1_022613 [Brachionus plicatilis]
MSLSILVDNGEALIFFSCTFFEQRLRPDTEEKEILVYNCRTYLHDTCLHLMNATVTLLNFIFAFAGHSSVARAVDSIFRVTINFDVFDILLKLLLKWIKQQLIVTEIPCTNPSQANK